MKNESLKGLMSLKSRYAGTLLLIVIALFINIVTLKDGHNWGDDFAQYIIYARNMIHGRTLTDGIMIGLQTFPPAGYSLLLAPVIYFKGIDFLLMKLLTVFFWFGMILGYFYFMRARKEKGVLHLSALLLISSSFFTYKQSLSPDIPFAFYVVWAIYFFEKYQATLKKYFFYLFLLLTDLAVLTRSAGVFLLVAAGFYCFFILKKRKDLLWLIGSFLGCFWFQQTFIGIEVHAPWSMYMSHFPDTFKAMIDNLPCIFKSMVMQIVPPLTGLAAGIYCFTDPFLERVAALLLFVILLLMMFYRIWMKRVTFLDLAFMCYLFGLVSWSGAIPHPPEIFARYIIPVYGFVLFYFLKALRSLSVSLCRIALGLVLFINGWNIYCSYNFNDDAILKSNAQEMFGWIRSNTGNNDKIMFTPPRALALMTERQVGPIWFGNDGMNLLEIEQRHYKYVVLFKDTVSESAWIFGAGIKSHLVWENEQFVIYQIS